MHLSKNRLKNMSAAFAAALVCSAIASSVAFAGGPGSNDKTTWSIDLDCTACHATEVASLTEIASDKGGAAAAEKTSPTEAADNSTDGKTDADLPMTGLEGYAAEHVASFGLECSTCHEDSDKLAKAHKKMNRKGQEATSLKKTVVSSEVCLSCHNADELAEATQDCTVLTDSKGTTVNPHDLPDVEEHASINCVDCHQVHETDKSLDQAAKATCGNCHHAGIYECGTCH